MEEILEVFSKRLKSLESAEKAIDLEKIIEALRIEKFVSSEKLEIIGGIVKSEYSWNYPNIDSKYNHDSYVSERSELSAKNKHFPSKEFFNEFESYLKVAKSIQIKIDSEYDKYYGSEYGYDVDPNSVGLLTDELDYYLLSCV
ncbi:hypothetical protein [Mucilaginibacter rubeus]|uniref:hypothetical protein n=1 Tax=Mucilaginibacter rubeus TaxID=2027860 RepID=UPI001669537E|nr:hypothetical protein [Mucilaginibacter rubeus]GGB04843.1 hypothetical protein GCM10011500_20510 [Mucilaginibacter rubeus]